MSKFRSLGPGLALALLLGGCAGGTRVVQPESAAEHLERGNEALASGDHERAAAEYGEAIRIDPEYAFAYYDRGNLRLSANDLDGAIADYNAAIRLVPDLAYAYVNRGNAWMRKDEYARAIGDYDRAIRLKPQFAPAYRNRGSARLARREYRRAVADLEQAIRLDSRNAGALDSLAWILATCPEDALRDGKRAVRLAWDTASLTEWRNPVFLGTLAAAYAESERFDEAERWQRRALDLIPAGAPAEAAARQRLALYRAGKPLRE